MENYYKIKSRTEQGDEGESLYWSDREGWVGFVKSDTYSQAEQWDLELPENGQWVGIKEVFHQA